MGLSDADFWNMTPRSFAAIQRAYARIHWQVVESAVSEKELSDARALAVFEDMAERERLKRDGGTP